MKSERVCAVVGVGPGIGAAIARRFAHAGYGVALLARSTQFAETLAGEIGNGARAYSCDVENPDAVSGVFERVAADFPPQPGPGVRPQAFGAAQRQAHRGGRLVHGHAHKIAELNEVRRHRILHGQEVQGFIDREHVVRTDVLGEVSVFEFLRHDPGAGRLPPPPQSTDSTPPPAASCRCKA